MQNCCFKPLLSWDNSCFILFQNVCFCIWKSGNSYFPVPPLQVSPMLGTATLLSFDRANDCVKPAYKILQGNVLRNYNFPCIYMYIYIIIISLFMQASSLSPTQLFFVLLSLLVSTKSLSNLCRLSVTSCSKTVSFCVFAPKASLYLKL